MCRFLKNGFALKQILENPTCQENIPSETSFPVESKVLQLCPDANFTQHSQPD